MDSQTQADAVWCILRELVVRIWQHIDGTWADFGKVRWWTDRWKQPYDDTLFGELLDLTCHVVERLRFEGFRWRIGIRAFLELYPIIGRFPHPSLPPIRTLDQLNEEQRLIRVQFTPAEPGEAIVRNNVEYYFDPLTLFFNEVSDNPKAPDQFTELVKRHTSIEKAFQWDEKLAVDVFQTHLDAWLGTMQDAPEAWEKLYEWYGQYFDGDGKSFVPALFCIQSICRILAKANPAHSTIETILITNQKHAESPHTVQIVQLFLRCKNRQEMWKFLMFPKHPGYKSHPLYVLEFMVTILNTWLREFTALATASGSLPLPRVRAVSSKDYDARPPALDSNPLFQADHPVCTLFD